MTKRKFPIVAIAVVLIMIIAASTKVLAQGGGPPPPPGSQSVPLDPMSWLMLAAGGALAGKKLWGREKKRKVEKDSMI